MTPVRRLWFLCSIEEPLLNIGFLVGEAQSTWTASHDVDLIPSAEQCYLEPPPHNSFSNETGEVLGLCWWV